MSAGARISVFAGLLVAIFFAAAIAGRAVDPSADEDRGGGHGGDAAETAGERSETAAAGLASAQDGLRLAVDDTRFAAGRPSPLRFGIEDAAGDTVRAFETEQGKRMHVIVVRRDLRRYQHVHPAQGPDGAWTADLKLPDAGVYRAFADFQIGGKRHTLGVDLFVPGDFEPLALPAPSPRAQVDGYDIDLREHDGVLSFTVLRDGRRVSDLQPYLGARGHLVALREGDLAYSHVHPVESEAPRIAFETGPLKPGVHRLFLQFRHRGRVHTAAFTR